MVIAHHPAPWARWHPSTFALRPFRLSKRWAAGTWRPISWESEALADYEDLGVHPLE